jgi:hypothetical protein
VNAVLERLAVRYAALGTQNSERVVKVRFGIRSEFERLLPVLVPERERPAVLGEWWRVAARVKGGAA